MDQVILCALCLAALVFVFAAALSVSTLMLEAWRYEQRKRPSDRFGGMPAQKPSRPATLVRYALKCETRSVDGVDVQWLKPSVTKSTDGGQTWRE